MLVESYILTHNSPRRLKDCLWRLIRADARFFTRPITVVDQSTLDGCKKENKEIAAEYNVQYRENENLGASGGRWHCAQLHHASDADAMFYFEDDLIFNLEQKVLNKFGFPALLGAPFDLAIQAVQDLKLDYVKFAFQEHFGVHTRLWPGGNVAKYELHRVRDCNVFVGDVYYCNWPMLITKKCSRLIFLDEPKGEAATAKFALALMREQNLRFGVFAADMVMHSNLDRRRSDDVDLRQPTKKTVKPAESSDVA